MAFAVSERLRTVHVEEPQDAGGLQVFGLRWDSGGLSYVTLDEGLLGGVLEVSEISDGGSVPTLKIANKGDRMAFLMAGEQLSGGKQNRVLNSSIMVAAKSEMPIPVSCVERGRWAYRSSHFGSTGSSSHSALRRMMQSHTTEGYRTSGQPMSKQSEIWQEVDRKLAESSSNSPSQVLQQAYEDTERVLGDVVAQLGPPAGACGAVFAYGGRIVGFDLFDQPETLSRLWPKLIRAYAIDAHYASGTTPVTRDVVETWLDGAGMAKEEVFKSPGLGNDVRLDAPQLVGACLLVDDQPVHVEVFAEHAAAK